VRQLLPKRAEIWVMGDTGFQSVPLLSWLRRQGWHFVIRQQGRNKVRWAGQPWIKINHVFVKPKRQHFLIENNST